MIKLYYANGEKLKGDFSLLLSCLEEVRKERVLRLASPQKRREKLTAELLLQYALKKEGRNVKDIFYSDKGKPCVEGAEFNLSHSGGKVALAVSDCAVGVDIERIKPARLGVAKRFFTARERALIKENSDFFRFWTAKESFCKMTGEGLLILPKVEYVDGRIFWGGVAQACYLHEFAWEDCIVHLCLEKEDAVKVEEVVFE